MKEIYQMNKFINVSKTERSTQREVSIETGNIDHMTNNKYTQIKTNQHKNLKICAIRTPKPIANS